VKVATTTGVVKQIIGNGALSQNSRTRLSVCLSVCVPSAKEASLQHEFVLYAAIGTDTGHVDCLNGVLNYFRLFIVSF
jgi:hypothetical protein